MLERSPTFHVYADVLNAAFRILGRHVSQEAVVRLDTPAVALAGYVGGHALAGALAGVLAGTLRRGGRPLGALGRLLVLGVALTLLDTLGFGAVWRHRGLDVGVGLAIAATGGLIAAAAGGIGGGTLAALVPRRVNVLLSWALPLAALAGATLTLVAARRGPSSPPGQLVDAVTRVDTGHKVALLGVDGLDWNLVRLAIDDGRLPRLAALLDRGVSGTLRSIRPPKSPVVWTSIATGMLPETHGIRDFLVRRADQRIPVTSNLRRSPALWNMAVPAEFTVAFVNWYVTWPAEAVPGLMVSDRVDFDGLARRVFPEEFTAVVDSARAEIDASAARDAARFTQSSGDFDSWRAGRWGQVRRALRVLDDVIRHDLVTLESTRLALRNGQPDLTALYFRGNDNTQHLFWKYRLARERKRMARLVYDDLDEADVERLSEVIDRYYDFVDEMVGEVVDLLAPETALFVLSDHGFLTNNERSRWFHPNRLLEAAGLAVLAPGLGGLADSAASTVYEPGVPTVSPIRELRPGALADDPRAALEEAKRVLAAAVTDREDPLFDGLILREDETGFFLRATFSDRFRGASVIVGGERVPLDEVRVPEGHSGDHAMEGFLLGVGPPFRSRARIDGARAVDVAPTVLHLLGAPAARDMEGVVLVEMLDPEWMTRNPLRLVESYGRREIDDSAAIVSDADEAITEELRALGYIQ